jgi:hypothetical protein
MYFCGDGRVYIRDAFKFKVKYANISGGGSERFRDFDKEKGRPFRMTFIFTPLPSASCVDSYSICCHCTHYYFSYFRYDASAQLRCGPPQRRYKRQGGEKACGQHLRKKGAEDKGDLQDFETDYGWKNTDDKRKFILKKTIPTADLIAAIAAMSKLTAAFA